MADKRAAPPFLRYLRKTGRGVLDTPPPPSGRGNCFVRYIHNSKKNTFNVLDVNIRNPPALSCRGTFISARDSYWPEIALTRVQKVHEFILANSSYWPEVALAESGQNAADSAAG